MSLKMRRLAPIITAIMGAALALGVALPASGGSAGASDGASDGATEEATAPEVRSKTLLSRIYDVDKKYRSMKGPSSMVSVQLGETEKPELLWITGYEATMVGADGETPMPQEFMCHSNLDVKSGAHRRAVGASVGFNPRLFTLSQGQFKVAFPPGFGIPIRSDESMNLTTQVLNLNAENEKFKVRHKVAITYVRDAEASEPMTALFPVGAYGLALLDGKSGHYGVDSPEVEMHGSGCLPGENAAGHTYEDPFGRVFTGHWVVKPGREVNNTLVTHLMVLPYDTTLHYIAVHMHPFAESLELRDLTDDKTLFKSSVENYTEKIGLKRVEYFTSAEGIPIYKGHEYEIVSVYNNTTDEEQDSMAVMYLYVRDKQFDKSRVNLAP